MAGVGSEPDLGRLLGGRWLRLSGECERRLRCAAGVAALLAAARARRPLQPRGPERSRWAGVARERQWRHSVRVRIAIEGGICITDIFEFFI